MIYYIIFTLLLFLILGCWIMKKPKNINEYALGGKKFPQRILVGTICASNIGSGSIIGGVHRIYDTGLICLGAYIAGLTGYIIFAKLLAPKLVKYYGVLSLPELLSKMYGNSVKSIAGIISCSFCFAVLVVQIQGMNIVLQNSIEGHQTLILVISFLSITIYSAFGGLKSVIITDFLQCIIFIIIFPILTVFLLINENYSLYQLLDSTQIKPEINFNIIDYLGLIIYCLLPDDSPDFLQRILLEKDHKKIKNTVYIVTFLMMVTSFFAIVVGCIGAVKYNNIEGNQVVFRVINDAIDNKILKIIFVVAMLSVILSTADSLINMFAVIFTNDVLGNRLKTDVSKMHCVKIVNFLIILLGLIVVIFSELTNLIEAVWFVAQYYSSIILIPLISGLFISRRKAYMFWGSAIIGVLSYFFVNIFFPEYSNFGSVISVLLSAGAFLYAKRISETKLLSNNYQENISLYGTAEIRCKKIRKML